MPLPIPQPGLVICYSYSWLTEHGQGREEGTKDRPCAIVLTAKPDGGDTTVAVVPITHSLPQSLDDAVESALLVAVQKVSLPLRDAYANAGL
jgi:hypothetical protein